MHIDKIGINYSETGHTCHLSQIERNLDELSSIGFQVIEFGLENQNLIINGEIRRPEFENFKAVFNQFTIGYTVHGYLRLNLAYDERIDLCKKIMNSQIQFCKEIGASRLVIHSGLDALSLIRDGIRQELLSDYELKKGADNEVMALKEVANFAQDAGVIICVENINHHLWEINLLKAQSASERDLTKHYARTIVDPIIHQLESINHPNVGMTLDFGHLFISSQSLNFDYFSAIKRLAPWVKHLHINDNFGTVDRNIFVENEMWAFGESDVELPPTWGIIPFQDAFACLPDYSGYAILEMGWQFRDYFKEALNATRHMIS